MGILPKSSNCDLGIVPQYFDPVIYHAPQEAMNQNTDVSEEEMKKGMEPWMIWAKKCGEKLVDLGTPLTGGLKLSPEGNSAASNKEVVGYSILNAGNMEEAQSLMADHPHLSWDAGCEIEIHESMPLPG